MYEHTHTCIYTRSTEASLADDLQAVSKARPHWWHTDNTNQQIMLGTVQVETHFESPSLYSKIAHTSFDGPASLGSLGTASRLSKPPIIALVSEWAGLLPLACHLTAHHEDYDLLGRVALTGRIPTSFFPRLGTIEGLTRLLKDGAEFLDRASIIGHSSSKVWDVKWGSTFPCANGAASAIVASKVLQHQPNIINVSERVRHNLRKSSEAQTSRSSQHDTLEIRPVENPPNELHAEHSLRSRFPSAFKFPPRSFPPRKPANGVGSDTVIARSQHRRYQRLNLLHFSKTGACSEHKSRVRRWEAVKWTLSLGAVAVVLLYGLYGTAAALISGLILKMAGYLVRLDRPNEYLSNNEAHDACMLVGMHSNCSTWYLYTGDRGVVDNLLNKSMVRILPSNGPFQSPQFLMLLLRVGHILHFLSMTFVAAQKGWDGVVMVILMMAVRATEWFWNDGTIAKQWLDGERVDVKVRRFDFEGRMQMMGSIHILSGGESLDWMDSIIAPHPRRTALFAQLKLLHQDLAKSKDASTISLSLFDRNWVALQAELITNSAAVVLEELERAGNFD